MNTTRQQAEGSVWSWPVVVSQYDRHPELYEYERIELECLKHYPINRETILGQGTSREIFSRLVQPLIDVCAVTMPSSAPMVVRTMLREVKRRHLPYWTWSGDEWVESICQDSKAFRERFDSISKRIRLQIMAMGYLLCGFDRLSEVGHYNRYVFAVRVFGEEEVAASLKLVSDALYSLGYNHSLRVMNWHNVLGEALLINRSPRVCDLTGGVLQKLRQNNSAPQAARGSVALSRALQSLGIVSQPLPPAGMGPKKYDHHDPASRVSPEWVQWCERWRQTSTSSDKTKGATFTMLIKIGRWLADKHPKVDSPEQWTRELAADFVAAVDQMNVGDYMHPSTHHVPARKIGKPLRNNSKVSIVTAARVFFRDGQEWGWFPRKFDPIRAIPFPQKWLSERKPSPRLIADDVWAKLLWAGLNLTAEDLPVCTYHAGGATMLKEVPWYPLKMVRAVTILWLFAGLRCDEIIRLRVGCVRWEIDSAGRSSISNSSDVQRVCLLDIPVNKTGAAFTKPVDRYVGEALTEWELERPTQPPLLDRKTGSLEHLLFMYRGKSIGQAYLNVTIIPMLCHKAGVPIVDARGRITSHRARSTIATQLFNAKEPMSLFELQEWLGHRSVASTQYYAKITQTKLVKSYRNAGYFERNRHAIEVLLDQEVIRNGAASRGEPWKYYDLGHGYCTYDFF
jgi:integrase